MRVSWGQVALLQRGVVFSRPDGMFELYIGLSVV